MDSLHAEEVGLYFIRYEHVLECDHNVPFDSSSQQAKAGSSFLKSIEPICLTGQKCEFLISLEHFKQFNYGRDYCLSDLPMPSYVVTY